MSKVVYFGVFQRFMQQNSESQAKQYLCKELKYVKNQLFLCFMHQNSEMQAKHYIC
ncbi:hypothetical protein E2C01_066535 [Portunus trituberculatus]|uniref:Uncharacterized protein n=1 Tax=Portunus trituberculatus TaxID=210409 RepID=A0A5B7HSK6_PORTR|nr:hypothetical protein [Portunus trituberculatus]